MIEMKVTGIALEAASRSPIVLLRDGAERRALPIWISQDQARAILALLEGQQPVRPLTHDLMATSLEAWEVGLDRVLIHTLKDGTFFACIKLRQGDREQELDARPSDAIALALRMEAPIWVAEEVMAEASIPVDMAADEAERRAFREFLSDINPADLIQRHRPDAGGN